MPFAVSITGAGFNPIIAFASGSNLYGQWPTIEFTNNDTVSHQLQFWMVAGPNGQVPVPFGISVPYDLAIPAPIAPGDTLSMQFQAPGTFQYKSLIGPNGALWTNPANGQVITGEVAIVIIV